MPKEEALLGQEMILVEAVLGRYLAEIESLDFILSDVSLRPPPFGAGKCSLNNNDRNP